MFLIGTIWYSIVSVTTGRTPPGIACRMRKAISESRFHASPHSAEPAAKPSTAST
jgi:hypothetical protein